MSDNTALSGKYLTPSRDSAIQSARLLCHLLEEAEQATPEAATALFCAAHALAGHTLLCIEASGNEDDA